MELVEDKLIKETIQKLENKISKNLAKLVEESIRKFSNEYAITNDTAYLIENIYENKVEEIIDAICKNPNLIKTEEDAKMVAFLRPEELYSDSYDILLKKKEIKEIKQNDVKSSSAFKCSKCKKSKCSVTQKQTRRGDEPATTFVTCLECGYSFSFN